MKHIIGNLYQKWIHKLFGRMVWVSLMAIAIHLLTVACAQVTPLEGGPMDTIPPQLLSSVPLHESTGFKQKELRLEFDKEIEVQDIYNRLVVTPKLAVLEDKPSYTYKARGKTLRLQLNSPLQEETTYTFNFKDAIKDTKEGTPAENLVLTFSTGDHIDDRYATGMVKYLMTDEPAKNILVSLYRFVEEPAADTLHILNSNPDYFTKTNEEGYFKLDHIKEGKYRIYAGQSEENKLTIDPNKEPYGFLKEPIDLNQPVEDISMVIVQADVTDFRLQGTQPQGPWFELNFSKAVVQYQLKLMHQLKRFKEGILYSNLIEKGQTIRVYNTLGLLEEDVLEALLVAEDAMGNTLQDTVSIQFRERKTNKEPLKYTFDPLSGTKIKPDFFEGHIVVNKPIKKVQPANIFFLANDQDTIHVSDQDIHFNEHQDSITIQKQFSPAVFGPMAAPLNSEATQQSLTLHLAQGAFLSVEQEPNEAATYKYTLKNPQECGIIKGRIITQAPGFIIQLLNEQYEVVAEIRNKANYEFKEVLPGAYRLRVLALRDQDAAWCFGNIYKLEMPDPVIFYPHELPIVANWELDYIDVEF
jgi:hypothetical protein